MTRKRLYAYHFMGLAGFAGTLVLVAPPLAPAAIGFAVVYLVALLAVMTLGWLTTLMIGRPPRMWVRVVGLVVLVQGALVLFAALGGVEWAMTAGALAVWSFWPGRRYC